MHKQFKTIKEAREYTGLTQAQFAELTGLSVRRIRGFEQETRNAESLIFDHVQLCAWQYKHHVVVLKDPYQEALISIYEKTNEQPVYIGCETAEELFNKLQYYFDNNYKIEFH